MTSTSPRGFRTVLLIAASVFCMALLITVTMLAVRAVRFSSSDCKIVVAMYHGISPDSSAASRYAILEQDFRRHISELASEDIPVLDLTGLREFLEHSESAPCPLPDGRGVLLTFDDGWREHFTTAQPILAEEGFQGVYFIVPGFLNSGPYLHTEDIPALAGLGGIIGSHSHGHEVLPRTREPELRRTLSLSLDTLSELSPMSIRSIAAPGGRYNDITLEVADSLEVELFFTSKPCYVTRQSSRMEICRVEIRGDQPISPAQFFDRPGRLAASAVRYELFQVIERVVGTKAYMAAGEIRRRVF